MRYSNRHRSNRRPRPVGRSCIASARRRRMMESSRRRPSMAHSRRTNGRRMYEGYNYFASMVDDIEDVIKYDYNLSDFDDADEAYETLENELVDCDAVTGNLSGAYRPGSFNHTDAVLSNLSDAEKALYYFDYGDDIRDWIASEMRRHGDTFYEEEFMRRDGSLDLEALFDEYGYLPETLDVIIRCYFLGDALDYVLEKMM